MCPNQKVYSARDGTQLSEEKQPFRLASGHGCRLSAQLVCQRQSSLPDLRQAGGILTNICHPIRRSVVIIDRIRISFPESHSKASVRETHAGKKWGRSLRGVVAAHENETTEQKRSDCQAPARRRRGDTLVAGEGIVSGCQQRGNAPRPPWF